MRLIKYVSTGDRHGAALLESFMNCDTLEDYENAKRAYL